jgi:GTP-binding protein Era
MVDMVNKPVLKVYTKSDLPAKITVPSSENTLSISSISQDGFTELLDKTKSYLSTGPLYFPNDIYTKQDMFFRISEIIREKAFIYTKEELPHSLYIGVEEIVDEDELLKLVAYIYTETDSQKYIVIGKAGSLIQWLVKEARIEL